jgi:hypothetical protein
VPTTPFASEAVVRAGAGTTTTVAADDLVVSATEVATTDILVLAVTAAGAL